LRCSGKWQACGRLRPAADLLVGQDIRTVQKLLGHRDLESTMVDTHVLEKVRVSLATRSEIFRIFRQGSAKRRAPKL